MALILPGGPSWAHYSDNYTIGGEYVNAGVNLTAAANNTKGSTVTAISALAHDVEYLRIGFHGYSASSVNSSMLADIMIDYAGGTSWETDPVIPNLAAGFTARCVTEYVQSPPGVTCWYDFPIWIPAGASLGARAQTAHSSDVTTGYIVLQAYGGNRNPASWWCGQRITAIGVDTVNSIGVLVPTDTAPSWGAWTNVGSALSADAHAVQFMMQGEGDTSAQNTTLYAHIGVGGEQIGPNLVRSSSSYESGSLIATGPIFHDFPAGTQFQTQCTRSAGSTYDIDVAIYAVH
jgi:hypothetical protein